MPDSTVYNAKSDTLASILSAKHPARPSNAVDNDVVADQAVHEYSWTGNVFDSHATKIPKVGNVFKPISDDQVAQLEVQVSRGVVTKVTL